MEWYIVSCYSGEEERVKGVLEMRIKNEKMEDYFEEIVIPYIEEEKILGGKRTTRRKKMFSGYIFINMEVNKDSFELVKDTAKVLGFVGSKSGKPVSISKEEVEKVIAMSEKGIKTKEDFDIGSLVKVLDGPFKGFNGTVKEVKKSKGTLMVLASIFSREVPIEIKEKELELIR